MNKQCDNCVWASPDTCGACKAEQAERLKEVYEDIELTKQYDLAEIFGDTKLIQLHPKKTLLQRILGRCY